MGEGQTTIPPRPCHIRESMAGRTWQIKMLVYIEIVYAPNGVKKVRDDVTQERERERE
jgi:hypothetical protein